MIEKITHVRNPLTVIAIFAGLAEVSGTVMLPFLTPETQKTYVQFLMAFPILLVSLFFAILYWKHHVLYAPSDFRDDKTFADMWETASPLARIRKYQTEMAFLAAATAKPALPPVAHEGDAEPPASPEAEEVVNDVEVISRQRVRAVEEGGLFKALLIEEMAVAEIEHSTMLKFERNVSPNGMRELVFDGVWTDGTKTHVLEIKQIDEWSSVTRIAETCFKRVAPYYRSLPRDKQNGFQLIAVFVVDRLDSSLSFHVRDKANMMKSTYGFNSEVVVMGAAELQQEYGKKESVLKKSFEHGVNRDCP